MKADATDKANCDEQLTKTEEKKDHLEHDIAYQSLQQKMNTGCRDEGAAGRAKENYI